MSARLAPACLLGLVAATALGQAAPGGVPLEERVRELLAGAQPEKGPLGLEATVFVERFPDAAASRGASARSAAASQAILALAIDLSSLESDEPLPARLDVGLGIALVDGRIEAAAQEISRDESFEDPRWVHRIHFVVPGSGEQIGRTAIVVRDPRNGARSELLGRAVVADLAALAPESPPSGPPATPARAGIRLLLPPSAVLVGRQTLGAEVGRSGVARVRFLVDGRVVSEDAQAPWEVSYTFDRMAVSHTLEAVALDATGAQIARDAAVVNTAADEPWLRLLPPVSEGSERRVSARFGAPAGRKLTALELYAGDRLFALLAREPFEIGLDSETLSAPFLRAVAVFDDGTLVEDVLPLFAKESGVRVDVTSLEIFPRVVDREGRPARVPVAELELLDDGQPRRIARVAWGDESPLLLGIAVDTSGSMAPYVERLKQDLSSLFRALEPGRERAFVTHFAGEPHLDQPPTSDRARLAGALRDVDVYGSTALYDGIVHALIQFERKPFRRALVVLTDGDNTGGRFAATSVLPVAQRLGVPIYLLVPTEAIVSSLTSFWQSSDQVGLQRLRDLAERSGGAMIELGGPEDLEPRLAELFESLEAQAVVTFAPAGEDSKEPVWHRVKLRTKHPGIKIEGELGYFAWGGAE